MNCGEAWHGSTLPEQPAGGTRPFLCDQGGWLSPHPTAHLQPTSTRLVGQQGGCGHSSNLGCSGESLPPF